jgi:hypothetical protein
MALLPVQKSILLPANGFISLPLLLPPHWLPILRLSLWSVSQFILSFCSPPFILFQFLQVNNYGIRTTFACLGFLSALATCLLPAAIELGFYYVLACRVLQGTNPG